MNLTVSPHAAILCPPRPHDERGRCNPVGKGDKRRNQWLFLCLSFFAYGRIHIMVGLFGQSLRLVVPFRDIATPNKSAAKTVASQASVIPTFRKGFTA